MSIGEVRVAGPEGRIVHRWNDDDAAGDILGTQGPCEIEKGDRPFIFVSVIGAGQQRRWPLAALDHVTGIITEPQAESSRL